MANLLALTHSSKCPFGFGGSDDEPVVKGSKGNVGEYEPKVGAKHSPIVGNPTYPSDYFVCPTTAIPKTTSLSYDEYAAIANSVITQYEALATTIADNSNPRGSYAGCLVRLVGHDFMDYRIGTANTGGSDGCMNFTDADNLGLMNCIQSFNFNAPYVNHCTKVSLADYFIIAAEAIIGRTAANYNASDKFASTTLLG